MEISEEQQEVRKRMGAELRAARARRDLSRNQLAEMSGVSASTIVRVEGGERSLDILQLIDLCTALRIDPGDILRAAQSDD
ncbi:helix-turn-helix domain-containing protein [Rhodococcus sp. SJ-2]